MSVVQVAEVEPAPPKYYKYMIILSNI